MTGVRRTRPVEKAMEKVTEVKENMGAKEDLEAKEQDRTRSKTKRGRGMKMRRTSGSKCPLIRRQVAHTPRPRWIRRMLKRKRKRQKKGSSAKEDRQQGQA